MFKEINVRELDRSPIQMISDDWALLTAGKEGDWNTMTVSWGGVGELWGKDVVFVFVRPQRYTLEFMEKYDEFTLSFFDGEYKKELGICGAKSIFFIRCASAPMLKHEPVSLPIFHILRLNSGSP